MFKMIIDGIKRSIENMILFFIGVWMTNVWGDIKSYVTIKIGAIEINGLDKVDWTGYLNVLKWDSDEWFVTIFMMVSIVVLYLIGTKIKERRITSRETA